MTAGGLCTSMDYTKRIIGIRSNNFSKKVNSRSELSLETSQPPSIRSRKESYGERAERLSLEELSMLSRSADAQLP